MELDEKAWRLISALQSDGRAPLKTLAEATGLSVPATLERLRRLEEAGVVRGFHADIDPKAVGYGVRALVAINVPQPGKESLLARLHSLEQVLECHHVSGSDSYSMLVVATDLEDLEQFIAGINAWGETRTSIIFSTPIERRALKRPERAPAPPKH
jgi:Lrp/AsnC family transcriptional regulator, leucine-responsive regulatory protein